MTKSIKILDEAVYYCLDQIVWIKLTKSNPQEMHLVKRLEPLNHLNMDLFFHMFLAFCLITILLILNGCSPYSISSGEFPNKTKRYEIHYYKGMKEGAEIWWYESGKMKFYTTFHESKREGRYTAWYPNGQRWYEGYEHLGQQDSTLTLWYPGGQMKTQILYRDGVVLARKDFLEDGRPWGSAPLKPGASIQAKPSENPIEDIKKDMLRSWTLRVQKTVESFWSPPSNTGTMDWNSVVRFRVNRIGKIESSAVVSKSSNPAFNKAVEKSLQRIPRFPPIPEGYPEDVVDVQYEFVSPAKASAQKRLRLRKQHGQDEAP